MISRKITPRIEHYYNSTKKALLIDGARQVGKTFTIREFGKSHFKSFIEINFIRTPEAKSIFRELMAVTQSSCA